MCKLVAELVDADKQVVGEMFARMERQSGNPGVDLHLTGEIYGRLHMKMRELGLDPNDTTPHELYLSLLNLTVLHDKFLAARLGIKHTDDPEEIAEAVVRFIRRIRLPKQAWSLKHTAAKRVLTSVPPKTLMKLLHYRSVDSMLKREPPAVLLTVARHIEPAAWQQRMVQSYKKLKPGDFEVRDIEVGYLSEQRWHAVGEIFARSRHSNIVHTPEAGSIVLLPIPQQHLAGLTLTYLLLTLHYVNEIRAFGTYFKFQHMRRDFGALLVEHLLHDKQDHVTIGGQSVHWRVVHRYYGSASRLNHPEIFEPHVQPEDLAYRKAEAVLYHLEPALHFWHDTDYVGLPQPDGPLSFNLTDMALNLVNRLPYERRVSYHLQGAVWNEVYGRYVGQRAFEQQILNQLDEQTLLTSQPVRDAEFVW
ncbi:MAG TPA: hypothetical protein VLE74_04470 [Candidatus Saccharimonadales bacterium]|nr:hypothetical protein [Candidatus Saccharimonadales bacterium]